MYKQFFYNKDFKFSLEDIEKEGNIDIEIEGNVYNLPISWLALISFYEVKIPFKYIFDINFVKIKSKVLKLKTKHLMVFKKPIKYDRNLYFIPGFTDYVMDKNDNVFSIKTGKLKQISIRKFVDNYTCLTIYDADKSRYRNLYFHILKARTFIPNDNYEENFYLNHKNGKRSDNRICNLEWLSPSGNNIHAFTSNLRKDNKNCELRDVLTGSVKSFHSISEALQTLYSKKATIRSKIFFNNKIVPILIKDRYEIRLKDSKDSWFWDKDKIKEFKKRNRLQKIRILNILTKEDFYFVSTQAAADFLSVSNETITTLLRKEILERIDVFILHYDNLKINENISIDDIKEFKTIKKRKFELKNSEQILNFNSLTKTIKFLNVDKKTFKRYLKLNKEIKGYTVKEII